MSITLSDPIMFGDTGGDLGARTHAADETITLSSFDIYPTLMGDAFGLFGRAVGCDETLSRVPL